MLIDILLYVSHDGKSPRRRSGDKGAIGVSPEEFRRVVMDALPPVEGLAPPVSRLQLAVLHSIGEAADFAYGLSRMQIGDGFRYHFYTLLRACGNALVKVRERESTLTAARALCNLPPAPSIGGRPCTSATAALALLARDVHQEVCQAALDVHTKARKKSPKGISDGHGSRKVEVDPPPAAFDKEIARRFNREFYFPEAISLLLTESRLELMRLDLLEAAVATTDPPELPVIVSHGDRNYSMGEGKKICVGAAEDAALQCFIETQAIDSHGLIKRSGYPTAPRALNALRENYNGYFASAIGCPGKRGGGGYRVNVVKA